MQDRRGDVVRGSSRVRSPNEVSTRRLRLGPKSAFEYFVVREDVVQTIAAEKKNIAVRDGECDAIDRCDEFAPKRSRERRASRMTFGTLGADYTNAHPASCHRVILRFLNATPFAN
jgi:hypothetical protein